MNCKQTEKYRQKPCKVVLTRFMPIKVKNFKKLIFFNYKVKGVKVEIQILQEGSSVNNLFDLTNISFFSKM